MDQVDVTWARALKIWWSFVWRASVLFFLLVFPLEIVGLILMVKYMPQTGTKGLDPQQTMKMTSGMLIAYPFLLAIVVAIQAQAIRWMLRKARWSDFRLAVLPHEQ